MLRPFLPSALTFLSRVWVKLLSSCFHGAFRLRLKDLQSRLKLDNREQWQRSFSLRQFLSWWQQIQGVQSERICKKQRESAFYYTYFIIVAHLSLSLYIYNIMNNRLSPQSNMPGQKLSPDTCLILDLQKLDVRAKQIGYQHAGGSCPKPSLLFFWRLLTSDVNAGVRS